MVASKRKSSNDLDENIPHQKIKLSPPSGKQTDLCLVLKMTMMVEAANSSKIHRVSKLYLLPTCMEVP
jgi:hypothetical protein